jgi:hypothetical protein
MKTKQIWIGVIALLFFTITGSCQEHKKGFPEVDYVVAKVYYFNTQEEKNRPISYIYTPETGLAENAIDAGVELSKVSLLSLLTELNKGLEGLIMGTSGCFIPRHGIVFHSANGEVVAAMSICFECESIRFWDSKKGHYTSKVKKVNEKLIAQQMSKAKEIMQSEGIKVFASAQEYATLTINEVGKSQSKMKIITVQDNTYIEQLIGTGSQDDMLTWFDKCDKVTVSEDPKYTAGGDKYIFYTIKSANSQMLFSQEGERWILGDGLIRDACIELPNGIKVGSSLEQVMATFNVYDGISSPDCMSIVGQTFKIVYNFEFEKLVTITLGTP